MLGIQIAIYLFVIIVPCVITPKKEDLNTSQKGIFAPQN
jgi:hypothetical protein